MTWFKRHWVDALMVALIVTVVGGVLTLVLRGNGGGTSTPVVTATQPRQPAPNSSTPPVTPNRATPPPAAVQNRPAPPSQPEPSAPPSASVGTDSKPVEIAAIPPIAPATVRTGQNPVVGVVRPAPPAPARPQPTKAQREPLNYGRADFLSNYRVAIATYSSATRAQTSGARLRSLGYPAQAFSSGNGFIVVAGPYARETSARKAFNKLRTQGYSDAVLYSPNGNRERGTAAAQPAAPRVMPGVTPPAGGGKPVQLDPGLSYLQVGAFKSTQSALPLLERLKGSGFKTLLRSARDGYVRVLVGPFSSARMGSARENLSDQGLTAFAVKQ